MYWGLMEREDIVTNLFFKRERKHWPVLLSGESVVLCITDRAHTQVADVVPWMFLFLSLSLPFSLESYPHVKIKREGEEGRQGSKCI